MSISSAPRQGLALSEQLPESPVRCLYAVGVPERGRPDVWPDID